MSSLPFPVTRQTSAGSHALMPPVAVPSVRICCGVLALALLMIPRTSLESAGAEFVVWATAFVLLLLAVHSLYAAHSAGQSMWLSPAVLLTAYFFLRYGCGVLTTYYCEDYPWRILSYLRTAQHRNGIWENLPGACHLILLFGCGMYIGLGLSTGSVLRCLPTLRWPISIPKLQTHLVLFTPVGLACLIAVTGGRETALVGILMTFGSLVYPAILLGSYWFFTARTHAARLGWGTFLSIVCAGSLLAALRSGQMFTFIMPLVMLALGKLLATGSPPWKLILATAPLVFHVILPLTAYYKRSTLPGRPLEERIERAYQMYRSADVSGRLELTLERTVLRSSGVFLPAIFSRYVPAVYPFEWGRTFLVEATAFVPRFLWPDKPNVSRELNLYSLRVRILNEGDGSAVFDAISEYYVNFAAAGVFGLSILHGFYWKVLHDWLAYRVHSVLGLSMFLYLCIANEGFFGVGVILMTHVKLIGMWMLVLYVCSRRHGRRVPSPAA